MFNIGTPLTRNNDDMLQILKRPVKRIPDDIQTVEQLLARYCPLAK